MSAPDSSSRPRSKKAPRQNPRRARKRWGDRGPGGTPPSLRPARLRSFLAGGAPERHSRVIALGPGPNRRPTVGARPSRAAIDAAPGTPPRRLHQGRCRLEDVAQPVLLDVAEQDPRLETGDIERFGLPHVPDARSERLVEKRLAEGTALVGRAKPREHPVEVG